MVEVAIILGYVCLIAYLFYLSYDFMGKPRTETEKTVLKWFQPQIIGIFIRILAMWSVVGLLALMSLMSVGKTYHEYIESIFIAGAWGTVAISLTYIILYYMFTITNKIKEAASWRYK